MNSPVFARVVVPVEFESVGDNEIAMERSFEISPKQWIATGEVTVRALHLAAQLAGEAVVLVHATPDLARPAAYGGVEGGWLSSGALLELEKTARERTREVLRRIGEMYFGGLTVSYEVATGRALDVIVRVADEQKPDALVMAASSRGRVHRVMVGSTVDRIVRLVRCPVVILPASPG